MLLLLGGREIPPGMSGANVSNHHHHKVGLLLLFTFHRCVLYEYDGMPLLVHIRFYIQDSSDVAF